MCLCKSSVFCEFLNVCVRLEGCLSECVYLSAVTQVGFGPAG